MAPIDAELAAASYRIVGALREPEVAIERQADGSWLMRAPEGAWPPSTDPGDFVWQAIEARAGDPEPMFCQRGGDGAWRQLSGARMWDQSRRVASALRRRGYGAERPIATLSGNAIEQAVLRVAAAMAGMPLVHLSPAYSLLSRDHRQLKAAFGLVACAAVFVQDARAYAPALVALAEHGLALDVIAVDGAAPGQTAFADLAAEAVDEAGLAQLRRTLSAQTWASVYFTSGSTGTPKAVPVTLGMLAAQRRMALSRTAPEDRRPVQLLDWLPWHHVFAGVANLGRLYAVGGTYWIDEGRPLPGQFDATLRNLREVAPTHYLSSPLAFGWLAQALEADAALAERFFSRLEAMGYGGAALPAQTWTRMQRLALRYTGFKLPFLCGMGSTETSATGIGLYWATDEAATIGLPLPDVTVKLVPLEGQADLGGRFELRIRGPQVFAGYVGRPDLTAAAFDDQGYYKFGDAARFVDPLDPLRGLRFDGRVAEDFKLDSGTWVRAGVMRLHALTLLSPLIVDALVCGHDRSEVGVLAWPNEAALRALDPALAHLPRAELLRHRVVIAALHERLAAAPAHGGAGTIERLALLDTPPALDAGEITDKGYVNQALALRRREADVQRLYAGGAADGVARRG
jgi:feruloyl-CoA synthase